MTEQAPVPHTVTPIERMIALVQGGKTVTQALLRVYGCRKAYYDKTTEEERRQVFCKPPRKGGITRVKIAMPAKRADDLADLAKREGTTVTALVNRLIVERLTLTPVQSHSEQPIN